MLEKMLKDAASHGRFIWREFLESARALESRGRTRLERVAPHFLPRCLVQLLPSALLYRGLCLATLAAHAFDVTVLTFGAPLLELLPPLCFPPPLLLPRHPRMNITLLLPLIRIWWCCCLRCTTPSSSLQHLLLFHRVKPLRFTPPTPPMLHDMRLVIACHRGAEGVAARLGLKRELCNSEFLGLPAM